MKVTARLGLLTLLLFCLMLPILPAAHANHTLVVTGMGADRSAALHDAMRNAIEQKIGLLLDSQTIAQNYQIISDTIYTHSEGYVTDYTIIDESTDRGLYTVTIRVTVGQSLDVEVMDRFRKVKAVETGLQDPRIGVMIADRQDESYSVAKNSLIKTLQDNGFSRIVDLNQVEDAKKKQMLAAISQNQNALTQALRTQFPVDYMIAGNIDALSARASSAKGFQGFISGQAAISLRMYNMNTGEIIYTDIVNGSALHTNRAMAEVNALKKAAENAGPSLVKALLKKATNPLNHIQLIVTDSKLGNMSAAQQRISGISGVSQVYLRSSSFGTMIFDLNYYGSAASFANALEREGIQVQEMSAAFVKI